MKDQRSLLIAAAWGGPIFTLLFFVGFWPLAGLFPPPSPDDSAQEIARFYNEDKDMIRAGTVVMMLAIPFAALWGIAMASQVRRTEREGFPVITAFQIASIGIFTLTLVIFVVFWALAAFRPNDASPDTTRMLNDVAWFFFLFDWTPFAFWVLSFAVAIFRDTNPTPVYPRWVAYFCLWIALMGVPGGLIVFFKDGAFAYNGALAFYLPALAFFAWLIPMTVMTIRAIKQS